MTEEIPVIDFSSYALDRENPDPENIKQLVDDVSRALTTLGFMYLKNYGIPSEKVEKVFDLSRNFFNLICDEKLQYAQAKAGVHGYRPMEAESLNQKRKFGDVKESFAYYPDTEDMPFPDEEVPGFGSSVRDLFNDMTSLQNRVLEIMAMGLQLKDTKYFVDRQKFVGTSQNLTNLHNIYYPALTNLDLKGDQVRCGEHSDYGGLTLLFQGTVGGLEVKTRQGKWIPATPMKDTIVVNIGDLMQRWTSDTLMACEHKIMLPVDENRRCQARQSIVMFGYPDNDTVIECLDGSNKYSPINVREYLEMKFANLYG